MHDRQYTVLSTLLPGKVSLPGSTTYELSQSTYFSAQASEHFPACIVSPTSSADVAVTIKAISQLDVKFAVRGGGHTLNSGAANISDGVVINLRSMNSVTVSDDKTFVSIGGGAKWGEVYPHLDALGLATSGGRVSGVGVGGLSLGGVFSQIPIAILCKHLTSRA
jgi:FAD/FMN-containing dehydrogenase